MINYSLQRLITYLAGKCANATCKPFKNFLIRRFIKSYKVDLHDTVGDSCADFASFNEFFTRRLDYNVRKINCDENTICAPCDGSMQNFGRLNSNKAFVVKNKCFNLSSLLNNPQYLNDFMRGSFATFYLAPHNYHRVHMPCSGKLIAMQYIPGNLFTVNTKKIKKINNVFSRNERVICYFKDKHDRSFALVLVGALIVGSIYLKWHGTVNPKFASDAFIQDYEQENIILEQGEEFAHFALGSTVIGLFDENIAINFNLHVGQEVKVGDPIY